MIPRHHYSPLSQESDSANLDSYPSFDPPASSTPTDSYSPGSPKVKGSEATGSEGSSRPVTVMWVGGRQFRFPSCIPINNRNARFVLLAVVTLFALLILRHIYALPSTPEESFSGSNSLFEIPRHVFGRPSDFSVPSKTSEWYDENCYPKDSNLGLSIAHIYEKLEYLKASKVPECSSLWTLFNTVFSIEFIEAGLVLPEGFQSEVKGWLGNDPELFDQVHHQKIYKIVVKGLHEETVFNPLRSRRPTSKSLVNPIEYIANLSAVSQPTCDFCQYKDHTAEDVFGRVDNQYSASASNTFKLAKFHALFFPKSHHPVNISFQAISDLFVNTSRQWFEIAHKHDTTQRYPSLLWDMLPHAGASQVHPHVHGLLGVHQYTGAFEKHHALSQEYYAKHRRSYWTDLIAIHSALGLSLKFGEAVVIVPLFARKDHEYMIIAPDGDESFASLVYTILEGYKNNLGVYCFSAGGTYPFMGDQTRDLDTYLQPGLPVLFRFGSRGLCTSISSDVSSLELYTVNNINTDISATFNALKKSLQSFLNAHPENSY